MAVTKLLLMFDFYLRRGGDVIVAVCMSAGVCVFVCLCVCKISRKL